MLDTLTRAPLALDDAALRAMFAARKQVFIDLLKWDIPALADTFEVDQFDDENAEYLILLDHRGRHRASARLLRTDRPHILGNLYPYLCDGLVPCGPTTREITRFCLDRNQTASERRSARNQLVSALALHALRQGITDYTGVAEVRWLTQILQFGWWCAPLGGAVRDRCGMLSALHIRIDEQTLSGLKATGTYEPLTLFAAGHWEGEA